MDEQSKADLKRIAELNKEDIGEYEEDVKVKFVIPFLKRFGYSDSDMKFEHDRIDIYIEKPYSIVIEVKCYDENLDKEEHLSQLKGYCDEKKSLLGIIVNGEKIKFYSPFVNDFSESCIYLVKRKKLGEIKNIEKLEKLLSKNNDEKKLRKDIEEMEAIKMERENKGSLNPFVVSGNGSLINIEREKEKRRIGKEKRDLLEKEYKIKTDGLEEERKKLKERLSQIEREIVMIRDERDKEIKNIEKEYGLKHSQRKLPP